MQLGIDTLVIIKGEDKTDSISSYTERNGKCNIVYASSPRAYCYNRENVQILSLRKKIDPAPVVFKVDGKAVAPIEEILDFGDYYRVKRKDRKALSYRRTQVELSENCLHDENARELFDYFKSTAKAISLKTEQGINILENQYNRIQAVEGTTVLAKYLDPGKLPDVQGDAQSLIYPFGLNQSQKKAVQNAFFSQISIIQGPPGTGKTQTILNILANAIRNGKTVAVVSNNNSATQNIAEKLEKHGLSFLTAFLGSLANKEQFLAAQSGTYPNMALWVMPREKKDALNEEVRALSDELTEVLNSRNRIADIEQELLELKPEQFYFEEYYESKKKISKDVSQLKRLSSGKLLSLWLEYEYEAGAKLGFFKKFLIWARFSGAALKLFDSVPEETIPFLQKLYYQNRMEELQAEKRMLELRLKDYHFDQKMEELRQKSMALFKAELAQRYHWQMPRRRFEMADFRGSSEEFTKEYPIVLSTTYSIKGTLSPNFVYDYLIVDEASQVDLVTGVLAFSCAKNIVIVGDQKQLPNVLTEKEIKNADIIWNQQHFDERYRFSTHSMLSSAAEIWPDVPSALLREHYRCHPKIAAFFNKKFYNGELIVMTKDHGEQDVLTMYRTAPGNHARGHLNQRQIDVIKTEVLPKLMQEGFTSIGVITPYRDQVAAISKQLGGGIDVATVHKFQGREKDAIVLTSVDDVIGEFVDDPNMLNVAVSRAVRSLSIVISASKENEKTNYGDLAKYIEYNNCEIIDSKVFSVFDLLYKGYQKQRVEYLKKHKRISQFDSENLAYTVIEEILKADEFSQVGCAIHSALATLVKDSSILTEREAQFAGNPLTHLDFLFFNKMDKSPILAVEVDGTAYHTPGSRQEERDTVKDSILNKCGIPLLRIRTNESGEENRITVALRKSISR